VSDLNALVTRGHYACVSEMEKYNYMKTLTLMIGAALLLSGAILNAQTETTPKYEVGLNYSWLHVTADNRDYQRTGNGGSGYLEYNLGNMLGLVADFGGYANTRKGIDSKAMTYMFGPRFNWRHSKLNPYAQFLFGGAYGWNAKNNTQNAFAMAVGGGIDYNLNHRFSVKPIEVEYLLTEMNDKTGFGSRQNDIRYSAGIVFKFGEK
jgi:opacity protein-like surface antigen